MKKLVFIIMLMGMFCNSHAAMSTKGLCSKLPGHWQGIFTILDQEVCQQHNGCSHLLMADVTYLSAKTYQLNLNFAIGQNATFNINCDKGVITSPVNPANQVTASCDEMNHCFVVYSDPNFSAELGKS